LDLAKEQQYQQRIAQLEAEVAQLKALVAQLQLELARLRSNSSNSSKPPSSDIVKPPRPKGKARRRIGGQIGHPRHQRQAFAPEQVDAVVNHTLQKCPRCGHGVRTLDSEPIRILQQVEIPLTPAQVTEHRAYAYLCPHCQREHRSSLPPEVRRAGLIGPRLRAMIAYLKGACHASFSTIRRFLRDVLGLEISRGHLARVIAETSDAMAEAYGQLEAALRGETMMNVDETGHKDNGRQHWTWCFRAQLYTLFRIDPSRGSGVLEKVLGSEFDGVLGCDYFSAYRKYMGECDVTVQFCLAHLIRDVKFLTTLADKVTVNYGRRVLKALRKLFGVIHRRERMGEAKFQRALAGARDLVLAAGRRAPQRAEAQNLARRFREHGEGYFRFVTTPGLEPTNNLAEQALRFVVLDRHVTQGTRSSTGQRWSERIWSAIASCTQQGRSVFEYLAATVRAQLTGQPPPPLLPAAA
jgi:transposase